MNIFMPEETITESVRALDDRRLIKQIIECKAILDVALDETKKGYAKHPVVVYYSDYPDYISKYGYEACIEYYERFNKTHTLEDYFIRFASGYIPLRKFPKPFYCEGSKTDPNCIRTTENTVELFREKLCKKWDNDKYPPKWTNREPPVWYESHRK